MTDESYSHKFMGALAESLGWKPEDVTRALDEIAELQADVTKLKARPTGTVVNSIAPLTVDTTPIANAGGCAFGNRANTSNHYNAIAIGYNATVTADNGIAIGRNASADVNGVAIGCDASTTHNASIALGVDSASTRPLEASFGNEERTRFLANVTDPERDHDAATKHYVDNATAAATEQKLGTVKLTHEITADATENTAVSPDAVYSYCPAKGMAVEGPFTNTSLLTAASDISPFSNYNFRGTISQDANGHICSTGVVLSFTTSTAVSGDLAPAIAQNNSGVSIPAIYYNDTYGLSVSTINPSGHATFPTHFYAGDYFYVIPPGIFPFKLKE